MPRRTTSELWVELTDVFRNVFEDDSITVSADTAAGDVEGWDSLAHVRLIVAVERQFNLKFLSSEVASLKNVGELVELIELRTNA